MEDAGFVSKSHPCELQLLSGTLLLGSSEQQSQDLGNLPKLFRGITVSVCRTLHKGAPTPKKSSAATSDTTWGGSPEPFLLPLRNPLENKRLLLPPSNNSTAPKISTRAEELPVLVQPQRTPSALRAGGRAESLL